MFQRARRGAGPVRVGLYGVSGSGKTWSALSLAQGLGSRAALVDSQGGGAALLADRFRFDMHVLRPPFSPGRFVDALQAAQKHGYDVVVLDGISPAWSGRGGVLEQVEAARRKGERDPWFVAGRAHWELVQAIGEADCHVLATMRAMPRWEMVAQHSRDGAVVRKKTQVGLRPEQRSDIVYYFNVFWQLDSQGHLATALKDNTGRFDGQRHYLTEETGRALALWAQEGATQERGCTPTRV